MQQEWKKKLHDFVTRYVDTSGKYRGDFENGVFTASLLMHNCEIPVFYGTGKNQEEAFQVAAKNCSQYLLEKMVVISLTDKVWLPGTGFTSFYRKVIACQQQSGGYHPHIAKRVLRTLRGDHKVDYTFATTPPDRIPKGEFYTSTVKFSFGKLDYLLNRLARKIDFAEENCLMAVCKALFRNGVIGPAYTFSKNAAKYVKDLRDGENWQTKAVSSNSAISQEKTLMQSTTANSNADMAKFLQAEIFSSIAATSSSLNDSISGQKQKRSAGRGKGLLEQDEFHCRKQRKLDDADDFPPLDRFPMRNSFGTQRDSRTNFNRRKRY